MRFRSVFIASVIAVLPAFAAAAESYPVRPIRLIVPVPPGGASDFTARIVGTKLTDLLGQIALVAEDPEVTVLDLLFHTGPDAPRYIWGWRNDGDAARHRPC